MSLAINLICPRVVFKSDNLILIETCRGNVVRKKLQNLILDVKEMAKEFTSCGFLWVNREGNVVADGIVKLAKNNQLPLNWTRTPPASIQSRLAADRAHCG